MVRSVEGGMVNWSEFDAAVAEVARGVVVEEVIVAARSWG